jgi:DNA-binding transcriptional MerR regulator
MKKYFIGDVSEMTGVTKRQLRLWEERGYIPSSTRLECGEKRYRQYDVDMIDHIRRVKKYVDDGYTLQVSAQKAAAERSKVL